MNNSRGRGRNSLSDLCTERPVCPLSPPLFLSLSLSASGAYNESWIATAAFIAKVVSYVNEMRFGFAFGSGFGPFLFHFGSSFSFFLHCLRCRLHCAKMFGAAIQTEGGGRRSCKNNLWRASTTLRAGAAMIDGVPECLAWPGNHGRWPGKGEARRS